MHTIRRIFLPELDRLGMSNPDFEDSGWAVVDEDDIVLDWYADKYVARDEAAHLNDQEQ